MTICPIVGLESFKGRPRAFSYGVILRSAGTFNCRVRLG